MRSKVATLCLLVVLLLSLTTTATLPVNATISRHSPNALRVAYVSHLLYDESYWRFGSYVDDPSALAFGLAHEEGFKVLNSDAQVARALVVLDKSTPPSVLKGRVRGFLGSYPTHLYRIVNVVITKEDLDALSRLPGVVAILPDMRMDPVFIKSTRGFEERGSATPIELNTPVGSSGGSYHYTVNITRAIEVWLEYGIRGEEVSIAIIDTGVDYGSPALGLDAIARDGSGLPLVFDVSSLGLVLTPVEAVEVGGGYVRIDPEKLYVFYPPYYVFKWSRGLWVSVSGCRSYSTYISWPTNYLWYVGDIPRYGPSKFGLMMYYVSTSVGGVSTTIRFTAPVLVVDSDGDKLYDTVYVDTTTVLYLLRLALAPSPCSVTIPFAPTAPDYSFADEKPIRYGKELVSRDLDGDGITDFSLGTLAGYVYDAAYAIIYEVLGAWRELVTPLPHGYGYRTDALLNFEIWRYEPVAMVWPGLDPYGDYVVFQYDYGNHGTFCATTAAGRDYYAQTGYGVRSMSGQAPAAKIAAAPALYFGTTITAIYFFTGFDLATPYGVGSRYLWPALRTNPWIAFEGFTWEWVYTGTPRVDITSNSYGISGWALWGWASGMDPSSIIFDYTTMISGVPHFVAVGNGGPGWGTIASPASSTFSIGVGAATEFAYRPIYGYTVLGASRQVISWSNRGPTELGIVKPDVVAVGAFAWAVGRTWEALGARTLRGTLTHALFSGTSQATPMAAGVGALVVSAYKSVYGSRMPAHLLKTILMNTAYDMGFDQLSQGAGFVDAYKAVTAVLDPSVPRVYSSSLPQDVMRDLAETYSTIVYSSLGSLTWYEPKIYIPYVKPGGVELRTVTIEGVGTFRAYPVIHARTSVRPLCDLVRTNFNPKIVTSCSGDSVTLNVSTATVYGHLAIDPRPLLSASFFEIEVTFPFEYFESGGRTGAFNNLIPTVVLELAYWIDTNRDGVFTWSETGRIYYDIRRANYVRVQIGNLGKQIEEIEYLTTKLTGMSIEGAAKALVVRIGVSGATFRGYLPIRARVVTYSLMPWRDVIVSPTTLTSRGTARVNVIVTGTNPGFYSGYLVIEETTKALKYLIPISYFIPINMTYYSTTYRLIPRTETTPYRNTYLRGAFDYTWRYESGDWRVFKVYVPTGTRALGVRITWPTYGKPAYASNIDAMVFGPWTYYMVDDYTNEVFTYTVNGVQLAAELSRDPRGWGGYNPTRFWDSTGPGVSTILSPTPLPGIYRVVVRNIQYSGMSYEEALTIELARISISVSIPRRISSYIGANGWIYVYGSRDFLPVRIEPPTDGAVRPTGGSVFYYIPSLAEYGLTITLETLTTTPTSYTASVRIHPCPTVQYGGDYIISFNYVTKVPVTTVGWIDGGSPSVYFDYYSIPIYFTFNLLK
ncbi:MAG: S8 family serine peptidase [Sulfolobales archaeon]